MWRVGGIVLVAALGLAPAAANTLARKSTCTEELRRCRRACAEGNGQTRRRCRAHCGEQSTCNAPGVRAGTFATDGLGGHLRQLTHFPYDGRLQSGCIPMAGTSCTINGDIWHPRTGLVGVVSSCNPFGRNADGEQASTLRDDGSGLRQLTSFRGRETSSGGGLRVELGGPWGYSARLF